MDAATENERVLTVARRYAGTCSRCDEDERKSHREYFMPIDKKIIGLVIL